VSFSKAAESPGLANLAGETLYATVIRTELLTEGARQMVGAGLRFDHPLFF
jgi:hypothetical protein